MPSLVQGHVLLLEGKALDEGSQEYTQFTLPGLAQLVEALFCKLKAPGSIPGQGTCLGCTFSPQSGCV